MASSQEKDSVTKTGSNKAKEKTDKGKPLPDELDGKADRAVNAKSEKSEPSVERSRERDRDRSRGRDRDGRGRDSDHESRGRDSDHERGRRHHSREKSSGIVMSLHELSFSKHALLFSYDIGVSPMQDIQTRKSQGATHHEVYLGSYFLSWLMFNS